MKGCVFLLLACVVFVGGKKVNDGHQSSAQLFLRGEAGDTSPCREYIKQCKGKEGGCTCNGCIDAGREAKESKSGATHDEVFYSFKKHWYGCLWKEGATGKDRCIIGGGKFGEPAERIPETARLRLEEETATKKVRQCDGPAHYEHVPSTDMNAPSTATLTKARQAVQDGHADVHAADLSDFQNGNLAGDASFGDGAAWAATAFTTPAFSTATIGAYLMNGNLALLSGEEQAWVEANKVFVDSLRGDFEHYFEKNQQSAPRTSRSKETSEVNPDAEKVSLAKIRKGESSGDGCADRYYTQDSSHFAQTVLTFAAYASGMIEKGTALGDRDGWGTKWHPGDYKLCGRHPSQMAKHEPFSFNHWYIEFDGVALETLEGSSSSSKWRSAYNVGKVFARALPADQFTDDFTKRCSICVKQQNSTDVSVSNEIPIFDFAGKTYDVPCEMHNMVWTDQSKGPAYALKVAKELIEKKFLMIGEHALKQPDAAKKLAELFTAEMIQAPEYFTNVRKISSRWLTYTHTCIRVNKLLPNHFKVIKKLAGEGAVAEGKVDDEPPKIAPRADSSKKGIEHLPIIEQRVV